MPFDPVGMGKRLIDDWGGPATTGYETPVYGGREHPYLGGAAGTAENLSGQFRGTASAERGSADYYGNRRVGYDPQADDYLFGAGGQSRDEALAAQETAKRLAGEAVGLAGQTQGSINRMEGVQGTVEGDVDYLDRVRKGQAGPSLAELQLREGLQTAQQQALGTALTGRFNPAAQRLSTQQQGALSAATNAATAQTRAQEQLTARQLYEQALGTAQAGAGQIAGARATQQGIQQGQQSLAQALQSAAQKQQGIDQQTAAQLAQIEQFGVSSALENMSLNDAAVKAAMDTALGYDTLSISPLQAQLEADTAHQEGLASDYYGAAELNNQIALQNAINRQANKGREKGDQVFGAIGEAVKGLGNVLGLSDENSKEQIEALTTENESLRKSLDEYSQPVDVRDRYQTSGTQRAANGEGEPTRSPTRSSDGYFSDVLRGNEDGGPSPYTEGADKSQEILRARAEKGPLQLQREAQQVVSEVEPVEYQYRPEAIAAFPDLVPAAPGERVPGFTAQNLQRALPGAVYDSPAGKVVDSRQVAHTAMAASAAQQDQLDALELRLAGIEGGFQGQQVDPTYYY